MTGPVYFRAKVGAVSWLTPGMVRITLSDPLLSQYPSTGIGDEYMRVHFPLDDGVLPYPELDDDGGWTYQEGEHPPVAPYTIRRHDPVAGEVDIDFVIHGHGAATTWARNAVEGDEVAINRPRGLFSPPTDVRRMVFATDATGLPALGRLLEQLDPAVHALCIVEVAHESHVQELSSPAHVQLQWISGRGNGVAPSAITEALRATDIPDDVYVWVAGESKELRQARAHLRHERGLTADRYDVIGYWTHKSEVWLEQYNALDADTLHALDSIWEADGDDESIDEESRRDRYEARLASLGL